MKKIAIAVAVISLGVALSGCAVLRPVSQSDAGPYPSNYKARVKTWIKNVFYDPHSLRDVAITEPKPYEWLSTPGYLVCLKANAKNRLGGYTGREATTLFVEPGRIRQTGTQGHECSASEYQPWPEAESM